MLELRGLTNGYGGTAVVRDIDLVVRAGEIVTLVGANGAGKSTLVKTISGPAADPARRDPVRGPAHRNTLGARPRHAGHRPRAGGPPDLRAA